MGFRLRNKSFYFTADGFRNRYRIKVLNSPIPIKSEETVIMKTPLDHHSFVRTVQNYRNISRHVKSFLYGDELLEQEFILKLKKFFRIPMTTKVPVDQIVHG